MINIILCHMQSMLQQGATSLIIPWNLPFMQMTWKASAALASGNTVVV